MFNAAIRRDNEPTARANPPATVEPDPPVRTPIRIRRGPAAAPPAPATGSLATIAAEDGWHDVPDVGPRLGRYEVRALLGPGGMGAVFEAFDPLLERAVAIKVLRTSGASVGEGGAARLLREGQAMARLTHPNVVRVYDLGAANGHAFVVTELVRGCTLAEWTARAPRSAGDVIGAYVQAGRGLAAAHAAGLVHRDFKPQNVLVADDGRVLVTDFGLTRTVDGGDPDKGNQGKSQSQSQGQSKGNSGAQGKCGTESYYDDKNNGSSNYGQVVSECSHRANERNLKGHDRKEWTEWCEERGSSHNYDYRRYTSDRNCYQKADNKGLSGDKRRKFINECLGKQTYGGKNAQHTQDARGVVNP